MKLLSSIAALGLAFFFQATDPTLPPATAELRYTAIGSGVQIYRCTAQADTFTWVFQEPEADLFDPATRRLVGHHTAGPTWTWADSSAIVGKVLQKSPASDPANIPSLLLETHCTGQPGALAGITLVRRSNTQAGQAPATGCDAQHQDNLLRVPYEATYTFYTVKP